MATKRRSIFKTTYRPFKKNFTNLTYRYGDINSPEKKRNHFKSLKSIKAIDRTENDKMIDVIFSEHLFLSVFQGATIMCSLKQSTALQTV